MTFLEDVDIAPDGNVWVAGSSIAHNRDGGIWKSSELPPMNLTFDAIAMTGDSEGWALGRRAASIAEIPGVIGRVTEGRWHEEVAINDIEWNKLEKVAKNDIWAIGDILDRSRLYHYDGVSWKDATAQIEDFTTRATYITDIDMVSANLGYMVNYEGVLWRWDGKRWMNSGNVGETGIYSIEVLSDSDIWAVGDQLFDNQIICHYDGMAWSRIVYREGDLGLLSVAFVRPDLGWAVGEGGIVLQYDGKEWREITRTKPWDQDWFITALWVVKAVPGTQTAVAVGDDAQIVLLSEENVELDYPRVHQTAAASLPGGDLFVGGVEYRDSDRHTVQLTYRPVITRYYGENGMETQRFIMDGVISDMATVGSSDVWAVGGKNSYATNNATSTSLILHYDGIRWKQEPSPTAKPIRQIAFALDGTGWALAWDDHRNGVQECMLLRYEHGTWKVFHEFSRGFGMRSLAVIDSNRILVGGTWTDPSLPDTERPFSARTMEYDLQSKEWNDIPIAGQNVTQIDIVNGIHGWAVATSGIANAIYEWHDGEWIYNRSIDGMILSLRVFSGDDGFIGNVLGHIFHWDGRQWSLDLEMAQPHYIQDFEKVNTGPNSERIVAITQPQGLLYQDRVVSSPQKMLYIPFLLRPR